MADRPNVLLVTTDQHRGDCVGADPACPTEDGHRLIHTPNVDALRNEGALFSRAYTPAPSCVPARRCLLTGQTPFTNGCPGWTTEPWDLDTTLPEALADAGYQTHLSGKIHSLPHRTACGFESMELHEALSSFPDDDYTRWLERETDGRSSELAHGLGRNSWDPRPWHLDEQLHPTVWTTERALAFLDRRDETRPFFLNLSYVRPHTPLDPPRPYWDQYVDRDLPDPYRGDWAEDWYGERVPEHPELDAWIADLPPAVEHRARAGYYGLISQIDQQLKRVFDRLRWDGELEDTLVVFTADHGEMLGDHFLWRKTYAFEGSARVPLLVRLPEGVDAPRGRTIDRPVGLEDLMPTILGAAGVEVPDTVEGRDLFALLEAADPASVDWRPYYHGEHAPGSYAEDNACQYFVGERYKYVWNPVTGEDLLFDVVADPGEERDLSDDPEHGDRLTRWRERAVEHLRDRPEGFVEGDALSPIAPADSLI